MAVKRWLEVKNVDFEVLDVDEKPELMDEIFDKTGAFMVPMIKIDENIVSGANFARLSELLMV